ncbi:MAG: TolC family protein [Planctomycetaceae bacterium]|nr:TolC family protein [Planctomycetaceae bacterium]
MKQVAFYSSHLQFAWRTVVMAGLSLLLFQLGCSRTFYRKQADHEAIHILNEKGNDPRWNMEDFSIEIDKQSRMFSVDDPDYPAMPPDDEAASVFMKSVDGMEGYDNWEKDGQLKHFENPEWRQHLPLAEDGKLHINGQDAVRLALLHSSAYQRQLETMYMSALDVSAERFEFDTQFYGGYGGDYRSRGAAVAGSARSDLTLATRSIQMRQKYAQGTSLVANFANSLMWQFSGPDTHSTTSLIDINLVQPLLRQGGKDKVLERLTRTERQMLYKIRDFQRYRKGFYLDILTGNSGVQSASRIGGLFGGSGLSGFTGVGSGGFGGLGGGGGTGGGIPRSAGGYLGLLQNLQQLNNQRANITALESSLRLFESYFAAGFTDFNQVQQTRASFYQAISDLMQAESTFNASRDTFTSEIGLPPDVQIVITGDELNDFNLIDPYMQNLQNEILVIQNRVGDLIVSMNIAPQSTSTSWTDEIETALKSLRDEANKMVAIHQQISTAGLETGRSDINKMTGIIPTRKAFVSQVKVSLEENNLVSDTALQTDLLESDYLDDLPKLLLNDVKDVADRLMAVQPAYANLGKAIDDLLANGKGLEEEELLKQIEATVISIMPELLIKISNDALELSLVQTSARAESITLIPVDLSVEQAYETASNNRLDWMNQRAGIMDQWRLISYNADSLESDLDIVLYGGIGNTGDNPLKFRDTNGTLKAGIEWDAPITRLRERNTYRQSLIEYEQAKRGYYNYENGQYLALKTALRNIQMQKINFEVQRKQLQVAARGVLFVRTRLQEPPGETGTRLSPTVARDLIQQLQGLQRAQDNILRVWVGYEIARGQLDLALGTMQIDDEGMWIDPGPIGLKYGYPKNNANDDDKK